MSADGDDALCRLGNFPSADVKEIGPDDVRLSSLDGVDGRGMLVEVDHTVVDVELHSVVFVTSRSVREHIFIVTFLL